MRNNQTRVGGAAAVLVTGAAGYLGRQVVAALAARPESPPIIATDLHTPAAAGPAVVTRAADIRDPRAVDALFADHRVGTVIHLAAIVDPPRGAPPDLAWQVDVHGTRHILESAVAHGADKLIVTSSGAAYGYHPGNDVPLTEDAPLRGNAAFAYSHHKRVVEQLLADWRARHPALAQLILRPGTILGARTKNRITAIFERPVVLGVSGTDTPFVFVHDADVVRCLLRGVDEPGLVGAFNVAGAGLMTLPEIAAALKKPFVRLPRRLLRGALSALQRVGLSPDGPDQALFLEHRPVLDASRLPAAFGFTPLSSREVFALWQGGRAHA